jgi:threonine dehydratase
VPEEMLIAASSSNFGQALAYACLLLKKSCIVVMPTTSAQVKIDAVREYGAQVELVDVGAKSRAERVAELSKQYP